MLIDIAGAEKKLRQADFFLSYLKNAFKEIGYRSDLVNPEPLEFFFSACLSAAQSVYYVLDRTGGGDFKNLQNTWRAAIQEPLRSQFGWMIGLRDKDVHLAATGAKPLPKYVADDQWTRSASPYYQPAVYNTALFGPRPVIEQTNPDGTTVSGSTLRGTVGLYIDKDGRSIEAVTVCQEFISQLRSLLDAVKERGIAEDAQR